VKRIGSIEEALAFVDAHGVVLASAKGPCPRLTEAIAGEPIAGSWWAHPKGHLMHAILSGVGDSDRVLVCRLVDGKVTLVHRRLWPSLVRLAGRFAPEQLARVEEEHTVSGRHVSRAIPFPRWVPGDVLRAARGIGEDEALRLLGVGIAAPRREARTRPRRISPSTRS
jgi:hypothetical protein